MMGLDVQQLGLYVIRPTLTALAQAAPGIDGPVAEALLLATAAQESQFRHLHQIGGPALGLWQMEPATHDDLRGWMTAKVQLSHPPLCYKFMYHWPPAAYPAVRMVSDLCYACAMARVLYWRDPEPLPSLLPKGRLAALALWPIYKRVWNTSGGKATEHEFALNYSRLVAPYWPPPGEPATPS
jgi:hypothetical protein